jgi:hypothetical protein
MGAHSASGHLPVRAATATAGIAAAVVTTATTGLLAGGTAFATDGHGGSGHSHDGGHSGSGSHGTQRVDEEQASDGAPGFAEQTLCDVLGDVDLGGNGSCSSDDGGYSSHRSSSHQASAQQDAGGTQDDSDGDTDGGSGLLGSAFPGGHGGAPDQASAPQPAPAPMPAPRPTSSVPDKPTVQPITAAPSTSKITG